MASIHRVKRSPFWWAAYTGPDGRRLFRSTKLTSRSAALRLALDWQGVAKSRATEAQCRRVLSDLHESVHGKALPGANVKEFTAQWIARKKGEVEPSTLTAYEDVTGRFLAFLGPRNTDDMISITVADIAGFRDSEAARVSPSRANQQLKNLRVFFQSAWRDGLIAENPAAKVELLKADRHERQDFTLEQLKKIMAVAKDEWRGIILAGIYTGQRLGDIARMTWAQVDLENDEIAFTTGKTGRRVLLPIAAPLREWIEEADAPDDPTAPLFPKAAAVKKTSALSNQFSKILAAAGLAEAKTHEKADDGQGRGAKRKRLGLSFHSLRHTATSMLKNAGVPEAVVRDIIGHESALVSRRYTHVDHKAKKQALRKMPEV